MKERVGGGGGGDGREYGGLSLLAGNYRVNEGGVTTNW